MHILDFLDHVTLSAVIVIHLAYGSHFFTNGLGYFAKVLSFCMQMPGIVHPTG